MSHHTKDQAPENELIHVRREKRDAIRKKGKNPYPNDFVPTHRARAIVLKYASMSPEDLLNLTDTVIVAGRLMAKRDFGKASFAHVQDASGRIQLFFEKAKLENVPGDDFSDTKEYDVGDIIGVSGTLFKTKTGELTISVHETRLLSKGLRPLPEKWHGLTDVESRYRQRYVDLLVNPGVRTVFETRSKIINEVRGFFLARDYIEVETPMLHQIVGGATARPFVTHHNTLDMDLFLRIAPELYLKRLLVGGFERVFEINKNFRNEGISTQHNPEFTMLEFYQAYATYKDLMAFTEELFAAVAEKILGRQSFEYQGRAIDFTPPWEKIDMFEATVKYGNVDEKIVSSETKLRDFAKKLEIEPEEKWGHGKLLAEVFEKTAEKNLAGPVFITRFPTEVSPLSRLSDDDPNFVDRFELYISSMELVNAFSELNDPEDQERRFLHQLDMEDFGEGVREYDRDYIRALEYGMPPAAGEGIGIDRLTMVLTNSPSIRDVILFPQLRGKEEA